MKQPPIKVLKPGYAIGYTPAHRLFGQSMFRGNIAAINAYQAREQNVMRMFDRTLEITA